MLKIIEQPSSKTTCSMYLIDQHKTATVLFILHLKHSVDDSNNPLKEQAL